MQPITWPEYVGLPCAAGQERATSESREVYTPLRGTSPSRFSDLCVVYVPFLGVMFGCVRWQQPYKTDFGAPILSRLGIAAGSGKRR